MRYCSTRGSRTGGRMPAFSRKGITVDNHSAGSTANFPSLKTRISSVPSPSWTSSASPRMTSVESALASAADGSSSRRCLFVLSKSSNHFTWLTLVESISPPFLAILTIIRESFQTRRWDSRARSLPPHHIQIAQLYSQKNPPSRSLTFISNLFPRILYAIRHSAALLC